MRKNTFTSFDNQHVYRDTDVCTQKLRSFERAKTLILLWFSFTVNLKRTLEFLQKSTALEFLHVWENVLDEGCVGTYEITKCYITYYFKDIYECICGFKLGFESIQKMSDWFDFPFETALLQVSCTDMLGSPCLFIYM